MTWCRSAATLEQAFAVGDAGLKVNYGLSPGDDLHTLPNAYVGLHEPRSGGF